MKDSVRQWLAYAEENLACARLTAANGYYNPALQNAQQAIEKALKALVIHKGIEFRKTHSVQELRDMLSAAGETVGLTDDDCELLDSIYLPSKYPLGSALPDVQPDLGSCDACISIADGVLRCARKVAGD